MSGSQKFVLILLALALLFVAGLGITPRGLTHCSLPFLSVMLLIARPLLMPAGYGANKIRADRGAGDGHYWQRLQRAEYAAAHHLVFAGAAKCPGTG